MPYAKIRGTTPSSTWKRKHRHMVTRGALGRCTPQPEYLKHSWCGLLDGKDQDVVPAVVLKVLHREHQHVQAQVSGTIDK